MVGIFLVWCLKWFYSIIDSCKMTFKILSIKFRSPKSIKFLNEPKGHLALRLNDTKVLESEELLELIEYVGSVFGVKFLTLISGKLGFEREIDLNGNENISLYHNYEDLLKRDNSAISVNLVDHDSESLFLSKLKESMKCEDYEINYKSAVESFTSTGYKLNTC